MIRQSIAIYEFNLNHLSSLGSRVVPADGRRFRGGELQYHDGILGEHGDDLE